MSIGTGMVDDLVEEVFTQPNFAVKQYVGSSGLRLGFHQNSPRSAMAEEFTTASPCSCSWINRT